MSGTLTRDEVLGAWTRGEALAKGSVGSPGLPVAPHPIKPRAPRTPTPFDPLEGRSQPASPYQFRPHRLGDLFELHQQDSYSLTPQRKTRAATPAISFPQQRVTVQHLITALGHLRPGYRPPTTTTNVTPF